MFALEIDGLKKSYAETVVLHDISLSLIKGQVIGITGPSGSGKTTLLRCIAGFENIDQGRILLDGQLVSDARVCIQPLHRKIGMVFQHQALWPHMTVYQNVDFASQAWCNDKRNRKQWNDQLLTQIKIEHKSRCFPDDLSGGERQRVVIARALACKPQLLLLDEPLNHLDKELQQEIVVELHQWILTCKMTTLLSSHDQAVLGDLVTKWFRLDKGLLEMDNN